MAEGFVDKVRVTLRAGNGGNGAVAFHREKFVAAGGPDGGDGGRGGDVILQADGRAATLLDYRRKRKYIAGNGTDGQGGRKSGKDGTDLILRVPKGTVVRDAATGAVMRDLSDGEPYTACRGGRGGWGNSHFATPTRQAPRFARAGLPGESHEVILELKLLADVGLIGFPNAGKSTLLSAVSRARPKIADYPFTTLSPNLGVVRLEGETEFVMADIPGLIEGASAGAGLGHDFLRHIDRCRLLVHVVDAAGTEGRDPAEDFDAVNRELAGYSGELAKRPQIVAANKMDAAQDEAAVARLRERAEAAGFPFIPVSAAAHQGTAELVREIARNLSALPPVAFYAPEYVPEEENSDETTIRRRDDGAWVIEGEWILRLMGNVNFADYESRMYFDRTLRQTGVFAELEQRGIQDGDTVSLYDVEFTYQR